MSDDLEIHVNLRHPDLVRRDGTPDTRRLTALIEALPEAIVESLDGRANGIIASPDGNPMGYWLYAHKAGPAPAEED